jgi:hypothetical protein
MTVNVLGLDLSMTGTGIAFTMANGGPATETVKTRDKDGDARLITIRHRIQEAAHGATFALIEEIAARSFSAGITGMVHGVAREVLIEMGVSYGTILPNGLKKYATGRGGATKTDMALAAYKRGDGVEFGDDNQCDAWWLWQMARDLRGEPIIDLPSLNRQSLTGIKIEWERK